MNEKYLRLLHSVNMLEYIVLRLIEEDKTREEKEINWGIKNIQADYDDLKEEEKDAPL